MYPINKSTSLACKQEINKNIFQRKKEREYLCARFNFLCLYQPVVYVCLSVHVYALKSIEWIKYDSVILFCLCATNNIYATAFE